MVKINEKVSHKLGENNTVLMYLIKDIASIYKEYGRKAI